MTKPRRVVLKEAISLLSDWDWHDPYELNEKYRVGPGEAIAAFEFLSQMGVLEEKDFMYSLRKDLSLEVLLRCRGAFFGARPDLNRLDEF